jgi:hypothetical protein
MDIETTIPSRLTQPGALAEETGSDQVRLMFKLVFACAVLALLAILVLH